jgi:hypothetical protein
MKASFKNLALGLLTTLAFSSVASAQNWTSSVDISTGVANGTGAPIPYGTADDTWIRYTKQATSPAYVCNNLNGAWAVASCARWITPFLDGTQPQGGAAIANYQYVAKLNMDYSCINWARFNITYLGGDNNVLHLNLNGNLYTLSPATANDYNPLTQNMSFNINTAHIHPGLNYITINVNNSDVSPTGFYLCGNFEGNFCP